MTGRAHLVVACVALTALLVVARPRAAFAQDRRIEAAAKDALKRARADFSAADFDGALARLLKATRACATIRCSAPTRAALFRDAGVMQLRRNEPAKAAASFAEAMRLDRRIELVPPYDVPDVRAAWDATLEEAALETSGQPSGDFSHTPAAEQATLTPVPVYAEYTGSDAVASVAVKYKGAGQSEWKRVSLVHLGRGWGANIPCADVTRGLMRYYIQGFDAGGTPNALSGDPKHPYHVVIRRTLVGQPPSLPGQSPPAACAGKEEGTPPIPEERPSSAEPATCVDDAMCNGGSCQEGRCVEPVRAEESKTAFARFWVGVSGSLDVAVLPSSSDVCKLTQSTAPYNANGYYCTDPDGTDYPTRQSSTVNAALDQGNAGQVSGTPTVANVRLLASFDYALSRSFLLGARLGIVTHGYPGSAAGHDGKGLSTPIHFEVRATYLFGTNVLAHAGFAPLVFLDVGVAEFDAKQAVTVVQNGVPGTLQKDAWRIGGPAFVGAGGGARYAFSQRWGLTAALKLAAAFGGSGVFSTVGPEIGLQHGF